MWKLWVRFTYDDYSDRYDTDDYGTVDYVSNDYDIYFRNNGVWDDNVYYTLFLSDYGDYSYYLVNYSYDVNDQYDNLDYLRSFIIDKR